MRFVSIVHSDIGIKKNTNQDSVLIKEAVTDYGEVFLAVVCDGMGGLAKGEVASAALVRAFSDWFENRFPLFLYKSREENGINRLELENDLNRMVVEVNAKIAEHGKQFRSYGDNSGNDFVCRGQILHYEYRRFQGIQAGKK